MIRERLGQHFPEDGILSEENSTIYPGGHEYVWVIDPLDGTTNFASGLHYWGVSLARFKNGFPHSAGVYFPILDEVYYAEKNRGALLNQQPLKVKNPTETSPNSFFACCSRTYKQYQVKIPYKSRTLGAAAYHLCAVADSTALIAFESTPKIWDIAGAWLVNEEAGGFISSHDRISPFPAQPDFDYQDQPIPTLAAANHELAESAHKNIILK
jgi:myo-inositol-1(or 4)-monophosphatase